MAASLDHLTSNTPMGSNLVADGATFRVWAPRALEVYVCYDGQWTPDTRTLLTKDAIGYWAGFIPGIREGTAYKLYVVGAGRSSYKRDPYARELTANASDPLANCVVRNPDAYAWHDQAFVRPSFNDLVIYELHTGAFYAPDAPNGGCYLDVLEKMDYFLALNINAIELLPVVEFETTTSEGYNGTDIFSPELRYVDNSRLDYHLTTVNTLLDRRKGQLLTQEQLAIPGSQLKALVDICHLYGIAVIFDVVYNHAGGFDGDAGSTYFFDNQPYGNNNNSCYFTDQGWAGGLIFAFWKEEVRQFLIDNARFMIDEYHADGFRYDQTSVIVTQSNEGYRFCQDLTSTVRTASPDRIQVAEYWPVIASTVTDVDEGGLGFDATWADGLRIAIRDAVGQAAFGSSATVDLGAVAESLGAPSGFPAAWKAVQCIENHDRVYVGNDVRMPVLADPSDHRSWYARSRTRVATALLLTAPGIPMLFMGQEFLEDKQWSDDLPDEVGTLIWWDGLSQGVKPMVDQLRMTRDLIALRRSHVSLRGEQLNVFHVHDMNRVLAFHRWVDGLGYDVVVVASLNESTYDDYNLGFPRAGRWKEIFNTDVYDNWVNPWVSGNGGEITAGGGPMHGMPTSAAITIPANAVLVFGLANGT